MREQSYHWQCHRECIISSLLSVMLSLDRWHTYCTGIMSAFPPVCFRWMKRSDACMWDAIVIPFDSSPIACNSYHIDNRNRQTRNDTLFIIIYNGIEYEMEQTRSRTAQRHRLLWTDEEERNDEKNKQISQRFGYVSLNCMFATWISSTVCHIWFNIRIVCTYSKRFDKNWKCLQRIYFHLSKNH